MLLVSTAVIGLASASAASAQAAPDFAPELTAQGGNAGFAPVIEAQANRLDFTVPSPQIVIADPGTPTTARDPDGVNGVGQMIVDEQNGFIGLCTASLINPRTVVFAAHCVNDEDASTYGAASGGKPIGFGFSSNNNQAGASAFGGWLNGGYQTNVARFMYNSNYVAYNARSTEPGAAGFLYADVAVASLDTPAAGIPTWALLFSPLPAVDATADGTGYHVKITGYGNNGTGTTGSTGGIDFRRRSADNMLGALASLDDFELFLFYGLKSSDGYSEGLPQNLYWIDFDDPRRGTASASPYDFNAWRDNAQPTEGITAPGDSGGPLILDQTFGIDVIIGTLSGGYSRFFNGQPPNGYGTASFYQPLYLYWDWVAQNNPYHYVSAKAGDGNWADPNHWQTNLDPNYMIIDANGNLVNGVPTAPGGTDTDTSGKFGTACFQSGGISDCYDTYTGDETIEAKPIGTAGSGTQSLPAQVSAGTLALDDPTNDAAHVPVASLSAQAGTAGVQTTAVAAVLPAPTLANGLPGASDFVPNDYDGDRLSGVAPRYFDVTLSATGTTTLDSAVTVDRFAISGAGAALDITATGSLTSLIDINQYQGMLRVNGTLSTPGDFMLMTGGLQGSGTINTPFFTNVAGVIAPGGVGSTGTLTFNGNAILSNGSSYLVDIGANGVSDRIAVNTTGAGGDGIASLGGTLGFGSAGGAMVRDGYTYTILTAEGGISGTFDAPSSISAILKPLLSYTTTSVQVEIDASLYADVVDPTSAVQLAYARLLDGNRGQYNAFADLYGPLDLQDAGTIQSTLQGLAPRNVALLGAVGMASVDALAQFNRDRLTHFDPGKSGGTISMVGHPLDLAATTVRAPSNVAANASETLVKDGAMPSNMSAYLAAGYINGDSAPMTGTTGRNDFDGWYATLGLELNLGSTGMIGLAAGYANVDGTVTGAPQTAGGDLYQATLYGRGETAGGVVFDGEFTAGVFNTHSARTASFVGTTYALETKDEASVFTTEVGLSKRLATKGGLTITPRAAFRASKIDFGTNVETGGPVALVENIGTYRNVQGRGGATVEVVAGNLHPYVTATYVHDFEDRPAVFTGNFVGGTGPQPAFALAGSDNDWGEVAAGVGFSQGMVDMSLTAETTVGRSDLSMQSYRGSITIHF